jgi:hypothetical protein
MGAVEITLSPDALDALATKVAERIGPRRGKKPAGLMVPKLPPALTPDQAQAYTGRCRTAIFGLMRAHPEACERDAAGIRRVKTHWLDAWCTSKEHLDALVRHHTRHSSRKVVPFPQTLSAQHGGVTVNTPAP